MRLLLYAAMLIAVAAPAAAESVIVQSTTSTQNSGLYDHLSPLVKQETGVDMRVVAVGTGQAIRNAANCDGDVLLVHAKDAEEAFVAEGGGDARHDLMYNDFVIVGPQSDPAEAAQAETAADAFTRLSAGAAPFVSRGDDSGTHQAELRLWAAADAAPRGGWYRESGSSMGAALNIAVNMNAYILTDRATWIAFGNKSDHEIVFAGDPALFNQYGLILVSPERCPNVNAAAGQVVVDWLLSDAGQAAINAYRREEQQLFFANAAR